jgi:DNA-binding transcriptional MerR regulator
MKTYRGIDTVQIGRAARELGVHPHYLRTLEWAGRISPARRDLSGRVYSKLDLELLRAMGVGRRPRRILTVEEAVRDAR